jgi:hypothetical protein
LEIREFTVMNRRHCAPWILLLVLTAAYQKAPPHPRDFFGFEPGADQWADYITGRTALHAERRAQELAEASSSLEAVGVKSLMTAAASRRLQWAASLGLHEHFAGKKPNTYRDVLSAIHERHEGG